MLTHEKPGYLEQAVFGGVGNYGRLAALFCIESGDSQHYSQTTFLPHEARVKNRPFPVERGEGRR